MTLLLGDCLEQLRTIPDSSVDCVVTDPPYGLSFMGKRWDYQVPSVDVWREVLRVLKPGGHALIACGTRTQHRMAVNIEDAGFEIRDVVTWLYGSGFPKSMDVSKAIDKAAGAEREVIGISENTRDRSSHVVHAMNTIPNNPIAITAPATLAAKQWQGFGTALKPACEFWTLARKPLSEKTVAANVLKWGTGALNIDGTRIGMQPAQTYTAPDITGDAFNSDVSGRERKVISVPAQGRWPANLLLSECAAAALDAQSGILKQGVAGNNSRPYGDGQIFGTAKEFKPNNSTTYACDTPSGASRFFYVAKASKRERGLDNKHPTVKPIKLMEYLITLVCPPGGVVLDPFLGSGSTLVAAKRLGLSGVGVEREPEYLEIARRRVEAEA